MKFRVKTVQNLTVVIFILISILACFYNLGGPELVRWDEYTNYRVVSDTIESGNFFTLKYEDSLTGYFFEKPPLWYWLAEAVVRIFGMSNFNLRMISAISGIGFMFLVFRVGEKLRSFTTGVIAWLVVLLTPHFFKSIDKDIFSTHTFKSADLDALQLLFIFLSINFFINLIKNRRDQLSNIILASFFTGLAYLTKGPFALLPGLLFFSFQLFQLFQTSDRQKDIRRLVRELIVYGLILFATAGLWHIVMIARFGDWFINEYFIYHTIQRLTDPLEGHGGTTFTYLSYLFNKQFFLFAEVWLFALGFLLIKFRSTVLTRFELYFPVVGSIFIFIFLTLLQTKLAWYLFYLYPFIALVIGLLIDELLKGKLVKKTN